jgi:glycosyltransferase involved in cell wall biosynthesis
MKNILIITYYWPPSGGAGVQRWLKLSKYLVDLGVNVHVLAPATEKASYLTLDSSLQKDIHPSITVHYSDTFEIINYYSKLVGKKNVPTAGFSNVDNSSLVQKLVNGIRSNFFLPDPRIGWKKYALKEALRVIDEHEIKCIITTSPPHSTQVIGDAIKKKRKIKWIVDFRDPWTDIYYYRLLGHSKISAAIDRKLEKQIIENCDKIITVSYGFRELFLPKSNKISEDKFSIIPNGFDESDFLIQNETVKKDEEFLICYTGTMSLQYDPFSFFEVLDNLHKESNLQISIRFVGIVAEEIKNSLPKYSFHHEIIPPVPHSEIGKYQSECDLLLLVIPDITKAKGITPGKLFEYLATRNQIIALGPLDSDVNRIIKECSSGITCERDMVEEMSAYVRTLLNNKLNGITNHINEAELKKYSRKEQAKQVYRLI